MFNSYLKYLLGTNLILKFECDSSCVVFIKLLLFVV